MLIGQANKPKHLTPSNQQCLDGWTCLLHDAKTPHNVHSRHSIKIKDKTSRSFDPEKTGRSRSKDKSSSSSGYHSLNSSTYRPKKVQWDWKPTCVLSITMKTTSFSNIYTHARAAAMRVEAWKYVHSSSKQNMKWHHPTNNVWTQEFACCMILKNLKNMHSTKIKDQKKNVKKTSRWSHPDNTSQVRDRSKDKSPSFTCRPKNETNWELTTSNVPLPYRKEKIANLDATAVTTRLAIRSPHICH